jgi:hypothetical protein
VRGSAWAEDDVGGMMRPFRPFAAKLRRRRASGRGGGVRERRGRVEWREVEGKADKQAPLASDPAW